MATDYKPLNGESPLTDLPAYGGRGGGDQAAQYYAAQDFLKQFGRNPTQSELSQLAPAYIGGDPNIASLSQGRGAVAQYYNSYANNPQTIAANQNEKQLAEAPKHFDAVNSVFQSQLGRAASQDELNHFGSLLASGTTDAYQLQQFLQQQPEYTNKQDQSFRDSLSSQLKESDAKYLQEQTIPALQSLYAKQGRSFDSSAFKNAATQSGQQQNVGRDQFLSQLSASQYSGRQQNAYNDYANAVQNRQDLTNSGINATYSGLQGVQSRVNNITDYNTQAQLYNQYLSKYGKRGGAAQGAITGGVAGAGAGAAFGPWGAAIGGVGGALLGAYGSRGGSY